MSLWKLIGVRHLEQDSSQIYLESKSAILSQRLMALERSRIATPEHIDGIRTLLASISKQADSRTKWNQYELAYLAYLEIAPRDELASDFVGLRSRTYRLDKPNKEIWTSGVLDEIQQQINEDRISAVVRANIRSIAQAIWECGYRYTRDSELKSALVRLALCTNILVGLILIALLIWFGVENVAPNSPYQKLLVGLFGVCGGLLSATLRIRGRKFYRNDLLNEEVGLFFRAVFGAIAAVIIALFLELRLVDFPFLHVNVTDTVIISPKALYIVGFLAGYSESIFFRAMDNVIPKKASATKDRVVGAEQ
jgi:hypothetical protein